MVCHIANEFVMPSLLVPWEFVGVMETADSKIEVIVFTQTKTELRVALPKDELIDYELNYKVTLKILPVGFFDFSIIESHIQNMRPDLIQRLSVISRPAGLSIASIASDSRNSSRISSVRLSGRERRNTNI